MGHVAFVPLHAKDKGQKSSTLLIIDVTNGKVIARSQPLDIEWMYVVGGTLIADVVLDQGPVMVLFDFATGAFEGALQVLWRKHSLRGNLDGVVPAQIRAGILYGAKNSSYFALNLKQRKLVHTSSAQITVRDVSAAAQKQLGLQR